MLRLPEMWSAAFPLPLMATHYTSYSLHTTPCCILVLGSPYSVSTSTLLVPLSMEFHSLLSAACKQGVSVPAKVLAFIPGHRNRGKSCPSCITLHSVVFTSLRRHKIPISALSRQEPMLTLSLRNIYVQTHLMFAAHSHRGAAGGQSA